MGKIFTSSSDRGRISKIYKELKKLYIKIQNILIRKWGAELNREFSSEESQMAKRYLRNCSISLIIREMQIKMILRYHLSVWLRPNILRIAYAGEDVASREHSSTAGGSANLYSHFGNQYGGFSENWESIYLSTQQYPYTQRILNYTTRTLTKLCS